MKLIFHGAAREVGRSCIEIQTGGDRYLLDFGVKFTSDGFAYPQGACDEHVCNVHELDGVLLSHAHLDHSGGLPLLENQRLVCPIFCTHQTLAITRILLKDSYKIARIKHLHPAYEKTDIREVRRSAHRVQFDKWYSHRKLKFMFLNAGHIPGSAMILVEAEGKRLLYTGDYNTRSTKLMAPATPKRTAEEHGPIHALITECTYGHRTLPKRDELEKDLVASIKAALARGGSVLIPVFAVGRAQELLIILHQAEFGCPIYYDGMAKEVTRSVLTNESTNVINKDALHDMYFNKVTLVSAQGMRDQAAQERPAIYVTTSGMMQGGPAMAYLKHLWHDQKNAVFLTGYQVRGTNGHRLYEEGYVYLEGERTEVKCEVRKFDFSGHSDIEDIKQAITDVGAKHLILQHGDDESVTNMVEWAKELDCEVHGPAIGDEIEL